MRGELFTVAAGCVALSQVALANDPDTEFTDDFPIEDCNFIPRGGNPFFDLTPGRQLYLSNVYYFGEEVDIYEGGKIVDHEGQWLAGRDKAAPGIIMPHSGFLIGARYYQELAPDVALDRAEHAAVDLKLETPAGVFHDCIKVIETSPLEPGQESTKLYCPDVGQTADGELLLQTIYQPKVDKRGAAPAEN